MVALVPISPSWVEVKFLGVTVVFWYMMFSTMFYIPIISAFTVPYYSLGAEMSPDYEERTSIMSYRSITQKVSEVGNFYALRFTNLAWFLIKISWEKTYKNIYEFPVMDQYDNEYETYDDIPTITQCVLLSNTYDDN